MAFVWIAWTVVSTQILHRYRDLTISVANLICATIVMLCMYLRKVYIYNKLTKDQENKAKIQQTMSLPAVPNMYVSFQDCSWDNSCYILPVWPATSCTCR
ncbi:hypothetical protein X975_07950, partial [Stegodyphus mimosarum]